MPVIHENEFSPGDDEIRQSNFMAADIINKGSSYYCYRGVNDNIFDKVFRGVYDEEIRKFGAQVIRKEYNEELKKEKEPNVTQTEKGG